MGPDEAEAEDWGLGDTLEGWSSLPESRKPRLDWLLDIMLSRLGVTVLRSGIDQEVRIHSYVAVVQYQLHEPVFGREWFRVNQGWPH